MFNEGVTLLANGQPEAALHEFQKSLHAAKGDQKADSFYNIAVCHARLGHAEKAVEAATEALAMDPSLARDIEADEDFARLVASASLQRVLFLVIELNAGVALLAIENVRALVQGGMAAAIWIPYFRVSERVKATFTTDSR